MPPTETSKDVRLAWILVDGDNLYMAKIPDHTSHEDPCRQPYAPSRNAGLMRTSAFCTLRSGHDSVWHIAGDGERVVAMWRRR